MAEQERVNAFSKKEKKNLLFRIILSQIAFFTLIFIESVNNLVTLLRYRFT